MPEHKACNIFALDLLTGRINILHDVAAPRRQIAYVSFCRTETLCGRTKLCGNEVYYTKGLIQRVATSLVRSETSDYLPD